MSDTVNTPRARTARRALRTAARAALTVHLPVWGGTRPLFKVLYAAHVFARESFAWAVRFVWFEPLFRSQCESVGRRFHMERLPYLSGSGRLTIGHDVRLSGKSGFGFAGHLAATPAICIGDGTFIGHDCSMHAATSITIGKRCLLAGRVAIRDHDGHPVDADARRRNEPPPREAIRPVNIGDDVWIGAGAVILKGVRIGDRAVVGAGAVITSDVAADCIVAGNPARVIRRLPDSCSSTSPATSAATDRAAA